MPSPARLLTHLVPVALLSIGSSSVTGQVLPGGSAESGGAIRAQFIDAVMDGVRQTTAAWANAWLRTDAEALADLYLDEAFLVTPDGTEEGGREDILRYFRTLAPKVRAIETFLFDMDASNEMAMISERYELHRVGPGATEYGLLFTVLLKRNRHWQIRSQVFRPGRDPEG